MGIVCELRKAQLAALRHVNATSILSNYLLYHTSTNAFHYRERKEKSYPTGYGKNPASEYVINNGIKYNLKISDFCTIYVCY